MINLDNLSSDNFVEIFKYLCFSDIRSLRHSVRNALSVKESDSQRFLNHLWNNRNQIVDDNCIRLKRALDKCENTNFKISDEEMNDRFIFLNIIRLWYVEWPHQISTEPEPEKWTSQIVTYHSISMYEDVLKLKRHYDFQIRGLGWGESGIKKRKSSKSDRVRNTMMISNDFVNDTIKIITFRYVRMKLDRQEHPSFLSWLLNYRPKDLIKTSVF